MYLRNDDIIKRIVIRRQLIISRVKGKLFKQVSMHYTEIQKNVTSYGLIHLVN